jgi:hypothetical protein
MAINVNTVYQTVLLILNKEQRGYMTPVEYNRIATQSQLDIFDQYFDDLNQQLRVPQVDLDYSDRQLNIDEKISPFKTFGSCTYNAGTWQLPTTDAYSNTILYDGQEPGASQVSFYKLGTVTYNPSIGLPVELQRLPRSEFYNIEKSPLTASTKDFPTYLYENKKLYVRPTSINQAGNITVDFLRKPLNVRWGYYSGSVGQYIYDPTIYNPSLLNKGGSLTSSITTPLASGTAGTYTPTFTGGSGNGLTLSAVVTDATNVSVNIVSPGTGYAIGDVITINNGQLGSGSQKPVITLKASDFNGGSTYGSTNFELQESEQTRLILKILLYAGIIIRDPQIVQAAASEVQQNEINQKS